MKDNRTVLLIDDDADDRSMFVAAIADIDEDIDCLVAKDADAAKELFNSSTSFRPDLIFVDMKMPRISGDEFIRQFRSSDAGKDIPMIIYSSSSVPLEIQKGLFSLGVTNFLVKSSTLKGLRSQLLNTLVQFNLYKPTTIAD